MPKAVFVSHAAEDAATAAELVDGLEARGLSCWIAPRDITIGAAYAAAIVDAIEHADACVVLASRHAFASDHVAREIELADQRSMPIVPLKLDRREPFGRLAYSLSGKQWCDASRGMDERLLDTVTRVVTQTARPAPGTTAPSSTTGPRRGPWGRRQWLIAAILLPLGALAAYLWFTPGKAPPPNVVQASPGRPGPLESPPAEPQRIIESDLRTPGPPPSNALQPACVPAPAQKRDVTTRLYNLALLPEARPEASSESPSPMYVKAHLNDGWYGNCASWIPNGEGPGGSATSGGVQHWAQIDLGKAYWLSKVRLVNGDADRKPAAYFVEIGRDERHMAFRGQSIQPIGAPGPIAFEFALTPEQAQFVRVTITTSDPADQLPRLYELEIYGDTVR